MRHTDITCDGRKVLQYRSIGANAIIKIQMDSIAKQVGKFLFIFFYSSCTPGTDVVVWVILI